MTFVRCAYCGYGVLYLRGQEEGNGAGIRLKGKQCLEYFLKLGEGGLAKFFSKIDKIVCAT